MNKNKSALTTVVNKYHGLPFDVYIGRGSLWGNPFPMSGSTALEKANSRREVIRKYEQYLLDTPELLRQVVSLHGKVLQCFCFPKPCHGDVLAYYADALMLTGELPAVKAFQVIYPEEEIFTPEDLTLF